MDQFNLQADAVQVENAPTYAVVGKKAAEEFRMTGRTNGGFAILDKDKVTFGGVCFVKKGRRYEEQLVNWTVSTNEIIGCSYTKHRAIYHLILAIATLATGAVIGSLAGIYFIEIASILITFPLTFLLAFRFFRGARTFFAIHLNGISFCYDIKFLEKDEVDPFQLAIQKSKVTHMSYPQYPQ